MGKMLLMLHDGVEEYHGKKRRIIHDISEAHRTPQTKTKREIRARIRYMRYAIRVTTETEKTAQNPQEKDGMKKFDVENSKSKSKYKKGKREKSKQEIKKENNQDNTQIYADFQREGV